MDPELLFALCVLWCSTTGALVMFIPMWIWNEGESFHPHAVSVDQRHSLFLVVSSETQCKLDCCVASISAYVAPRGSSGSKNFTLLTVAVAISGFLGSMRWFAVGDANLTELRFALLGFGSLVLTSLFELDVLPERFLEDKLRVTSWLIEKLGYRQKLPFPLGARGARSAALLSFLRQSPELYHLYDEDHNWEADAHRQASEKRRRLFSYNHLWRSAHMVGAISYVVCVTTAILLNDIAEEKVAWITGACFLLFSGLGYLTGTYLPLLRPLKGLLLLWNPFLREPLFLWKLQRALDRYLLLAAAAAAAAGEEKEKEKEKGNRGRANSGGRGRAKSKTKAKAKAGGEELAVSLVSFTCGCGRAHTLPPAAGHASFALAHPHAHAHAHAHAALAPIPLSEQDQAAADAADAKGLDNFSLRFARQHPALYLKVLGHILVFSELIAMLTPAIAMGLQWVTALCDGPPIPVLVDLIGVAAGCVWGGESCAQLFAGSGSGDIVLPHCILKTKK